MDFSLSPEQEMLRKTTREFAEKEITPKIEEMEKTGQVPIDMVKRFGELGFGGILTPKEYGGANAGHISRMLILAEIGRISASLGNTLQIHHLGQAPIIYFGTEEQKKKWLPSMVSGEKIGALAYTEPSGGSDALGIKTEAKKEGDMYVINGRKSWITNSHISDVCAIIAKTGEKEQTCFVIEKETPGFSPGREEDKMGIRGCNTGEIVLDNCKVPEENVIGKLGDGLKIGLSCISNVGRTGIGAIALGIIERALEEAVKYSNNRMLYGRPIAELQAIQWQITDIYMDYETARWMTYHAAWLRDQGARCDADNSLAKFWATEGAERCARRLINIYGAYGISKDFIPQRLLRDAWSLISAAGTSEINRLVMFRTILKKYS
jgi:alkylation response protein AidB-like acyl-CoA dehydrogenase